MILYYFLAPEAIAVKLIDRIIRVDLREPLNNGINQLERLSFFYRFIRNYLLDFLWAYALESMLFLINVTGSNEPKKGIRDSVLVGLLTVVVFEFSQLIIPVLGTFDMCDIVIELLGIFIVWFVYKVIAGVNDL